jgi:hypothetical protein
VGYTGVSEWTGGAPLTRSQTPLIISEFRGVKFRILRIRIRKSVKSDFPKYKGEILEFVVGADFPKGK